MDLLIDRMQDSNHKTKISLGKDNFFNPVSNNKVISSRSIGKNLLRRSTSHSSNEIKNGTNSTSNKARKHIQSPTIKKQTKYMDKTFSFPKRDLHINETNTNKNVPSLDHTSNKGLTNDELKIKYERVRRNNGANEVSTIEDNNDYEDILDRVNMKNIFTTIIKQEKQLRSDREKEHMLRKQPREKGKDPKLPSSNSAQSKQNNIHNHEHHHMHNHLHNHLHNLAGTISDYTSAATGTFSEVMFPNGLSSLDKNKNRNTIQDNSRISSALDDYEGDSEYCNCTCRECNLDNSENDITDENILINNNIITNDPKIIGDRNTADEDPNFKKFIKLGEKYHKHHQHQNNNTNNNKPDNKTNNDLTPLKNKGNNGTDDNLSFVNANKRLVYQFLKSMAPPSMDQLQLQGIPFVSEAPLLSQLNIAQMLNNNKSLVPNNNNTNNMTSKKSLQSLLFHDLENVESSPNSGQSYSVLSISSDNDNGSLTDSTDSSSILSGKRNRKKKNHKNNHNLPLISIGSNDTSIHKSKNKNNNSNGRFSDIFRETNTTNDHMEEMDEFTEDEDNLANILNKNDIDFYQNHISFLINRYAEVMKTNLIDNIHNTEVDFQKNIQNFDQLVNRLRNLQNDIQTMKLKINDDYKNLLKNEFNSNEKDLYLIKLKEIIDLNVEQLESFEMRMQISQENLVKQKDEVRKLENIINIEKQILISKQATSYWFRYKLLLFDLLAFGFITICLFFLYNVFRL